MPIQPDIWLWSLLGRMDAHDRFNAMRQLSTDSSWGVDMLRNKWFILLGWSMILLLLMLLVAVRKMRLEKARQEIEKRFQEFADRLNLTAEEREIVALIAKKAELKRKDSVFTLDEAFDKGLAVMMQEYFSSGQQLDQRRKVQARIITIRQKLGFIKALPQSMLNNRKEQSSRQIAVGTQVKIRLSGREDAPKPATVAQNDEYELLLSPQEPVLCRPGDIWTVEYEKAAMILEFEAVTTACTERGLSLNHTELIRYVNRRRFTRVAVHKPARIARFPIFSQVQDGTQMQPHFVPAEITEIAGPSVRLRTEMELKLGQRILLLFEMEPGQVVQDMAEVRDIRESGIGRSMIAEMIGLDSRAAETLTAMTQHLAVQKLEAVETADHPHAAEVRHE